MGCLGNVLWFVFGGAVSGLSWCLAGCLWCITVVGIPVGMQCFKFAALSFSLWKRGAVWWRSWFVPFEYHLADCIRSASCTGASGVGYSFMCDDYRNPVWFTAV